MPFAEVNSQTIHYVDSGGDGPVILLSHGFSMGHEMWAPQLEPLAEAGWRVVTYDERGWVRLNTPSRSPTGTLPTMPWLCWTTSASTLPSSVVCRRVAS